MGDKVFVAELVILAVVLLVFGYVIFVHSKRRWPHTTAWERLIHIATFDGAWMRQQGDARYDGVGPGETMEP